MRCLLRVALFYCAGLANGEPEEVAGGLGFAGGMMSVANTLMHGGSQLGSMINGADGGKGLGDLSSPEAQAAEAAKYRSDVHNTDDDDGGKLHLVMAGAPTPAPTLPPCKAKPKFAADPFMMATDNQFGEDEPEDTSKCKSIKKLSFADRFLAKLHAKQHPPTPNTHGGWDNNHAARDKKDAKKREHQAVVNHQKAVQHAQQMQKDAQNRKVQAAKAAAAKKAEALKQAAKDKKAAYLRSLPTPKPTPAPTNAPTPRPTPKTLDSCPTEISFLPKTTFGGMPFKFSCLTMMSHGQKVHAKVYYLHNQMNGCRKIPTKYFDEDHDLAFLMDNKGCAIDQKLRNVQEAGGKLAILIDNDVRSGEPPMVNSLNRQLRIPVIVMNKPQGEYVADYLCGGECDPEVAFFSRTSGFVQFGNPPYVTFEPDIFNGQLILNQPSRNSISNKQLDSDVEGPLIYEPTHKTWCHIENVETQDTFIALIHRGGDCTWEVKMTNAAKLGACAAIIVDDVFFDGNHIPQMPVFDDVPIQSTVITQKVYKQLYAHICKKPYHAPTKAPRMGLGLGVLNNEAPPPTPKPPECVARNQKPNRMRVKISWEKPVVQRASPAGGGGGAGSGGGCKEHEVKGKWGACNAKCGASGTQSRLVKQVFCDDGMAIQSAKHVSQKCEGRPCP